MDRISSDIQGCGRTREFLQRRGIPRFFLALQDTSVRLFEESKAGGDGGDECDE